VLDRTANLDNRVKQVEKLITKCLNIDSTCRYDTEEVEHIIGHMNDRIDDQMYDVRRELEGALLTQTEEWVAETVESVHEELRKEIEDEWVRDILQDMTVKVEKMVKSEVLKDVAQAVKVMKKARAYKEDGVKPTTTTTTTRKRRMSNTTTASTQSTATSAKPVIVAPPPSSLLGATDFQTAIHDIQKRYSAKLSAEEMMRVLDFLGGNLIEAVKYNGCGTELKWLYVQRWAAKQE
jgi:membrane-associated HD superfamily phosphohydrolase